MKQILKKYRYYNHTRIGAAWYEMWRDINRCSNISFDVWRDVWRKTIYGKKLHTNTIIQNSILNHIKHQINQTLI